MSVGCFSGRQLVLQCENDFIARLNAEVGALQIVVIGEAEKREAEDVYPRSEGEVDAEFAS
jgi:hypothetical protein